MAQAYGGQLKALSFLSFLQHGSSSTTYFRSSSYAKGQGLREILLSDDILLQSILV